MLSCGVGAAIAIPFIVDAEIYASYERRISPQLSLGVNISGQTYPMAIFAVALSGNKIDNIFGYVIDV